MVYKDYILPLTLNEYYSLKQNLVLLPSEWVSKQTSKNPGTNQSISHYNQFGNYVLSWGLQAESELNYAKYFSHVMFKTTLTSLTKT